MIHNILQIVTGKTVNRLCLLKSILYRAYSVIITFLIAFALTRNYSIAAYIGILDSLIKIFTYYVFDEAWDKATGFKAGASVIWLTGLSGSGKTSIAHELISRMKRKGIIPVLLDGDEIRNIMKLNGFDEDSRKKHMLNVGSIA